MSGNLHDHKNQCFMEFHTRLRHFISGKMSSLFLILPRAIGLFNHRQTAMYRGRRIVLRTNQIGNVPTKDWPIIIQLQDCNGPRKGKDHWKDHTPIASQPFSPSASKRFFSLSLPSSFFSLPLPSIQTSSINSYPNGTPVNNRGQALEMWVRLKLMGREYYLVQQFFVNYSSIKFQLLASYVLVKVKI